MHARVQGRMLVTVAPFSPPTPHLQASRPFRNNTGSTCKPFNILQASSSLSRVLEANLTHRSCLLRLPTLLCALRRMTRSMYMYKHVT